MGSHVSRTARIEPVAPAGTVYVTAPFAAALILRGERKMTCDYVGHMPAAKGYGKLRMYRLQATPSGDGGRSDRRRAASALPLSHGAAETFPFGTETSVFKVAGKIFALSRLQESRLRVSVKCETRAGRAAPGRIRRRDPGYHLNKRHWNTVMIDGSLPESDARGDGSRTPTTWSSAPSLARASGRSAGAARAERE